MRVRVRTPKGQAALILPDPASSSNVTEADLTYGHLIDAIEKHCGESVTSVKVGYPPRMIDLTPDIHLSASGVEWSKELLTVHTDPIGGNKDNRDNAAFGSSSSSRNDKSKKDNDNPASEPLSQAAIVARSVSVPTELGEMVVRTMPDDNSCLFHAISSAVLSGAGLSVTNEARTSFDVESLRVRVAKRIDPNFKSDQSELVGAGEWEKAEDFDSSTSTSQQERLQSASPWLPEGILGKPPAEYARWIVKPESWGGEIEVMVLAQELGVELCVVNVEQPHNTIYHRPSEWNRDSLGEENGGETPNRSRCFLLYSGIHYDVIAIRLPGGNYNDVVTLFPVSDDSYVVAAQQVAAELHAKGYNTNTASFGIKCEVCGWIGKGEKEASKHADERGHYEFNEVKK